MPLRPFSLIHLNVGTHFRREEQQVALKTGTVAFDCVREPVLLDVEESFVFALCSNMWQ